MGGGEKGWAAVRVSLLSGAAATLATDSNWRADFAAQVDSVLKEYNCLF